MLRCYLHHFSDLKNKDFECNNYSLWIWFYLFFLLCRIWALSFRNKRMIRRWLRMIFCTQKMLNKVATNIKLSNKLGKGTQGRGWMNLKHCKRRCDCVCRYVTVCSNRGRHKVAAALYNHITRDITKLWQPKTWSSCVWSWGLHPESTPVWFQPSAKRMYLPHGSCI